VRLLEYIREREAMSVDGFVAEHNYPVLLQQSGPTTEEEKGWEFSTVYLTDEIKDGQLSDARKVRPERGLVCPVVKQTTKAFEGMINVGRAPNNDIVIDVAGISKFHAYFSRDTISGACHITDANSKNGTYVNRNRLRPHASTPLKDGDKICFAGQVEFTFYLPRRFYEVLGIIIE
jgi:hypothetical protein